MKRILFFIVLLLTFSNLSAQKKVTETASSSVIDEVFVHVKFANKIVIKNWNKNMISVEATVNIDDNEHNDYFSFEADKIGSTYTIKSDYGDYFKKFRSYQKHSHDDEKDGKDCRNNYSNIVNYVIYVPNKMDLKVKSISGSVQADTFGAYLDLDLISGDIDLYVKDATFEAKTLSGAIYSDLEIDFSDNNKHHGSRINAIVDKGTASLKLSTISEDIFLRKS